MAAQKMISVDQLCIFYEVETTFVYSLNDHGLMELRKSGKSYMVDFEQLADFEKFIHLHYDLDINMEGLEAITHLLSRVQELQREIKRLKNESGR